MSNALRICVVLTIVTVQSLAQAAAPLKVGLFSLDATPPVGSPLAYNPMERKGSTLALKGVVLAGADDPIVLVAVDWIGIGGEGHTRFREAIARAVGTSPERVAVHCLHQHDAPRLDFGAEEILAEHGLSGAMFNVQFARETVERAAEAAKHALDNAQTVTHVGLGQAKVEKVASNRRILGPDGKVQYVRWTATRDPKIRAFPEGVIDPYVKAISFFDGEKLLGVVTYYATHPQSYYRTGAADTDFPGMAREMRQEALGALCIHFNGAGGNIGAGKYNDGSPENRPVLAKRVAEGMAKAYEASEKHPVTAADLDWETVDVALPLADHLDEKQLRETVADADAKPATRVSAAKKLSLVLRTKAGAKTTIGCLSLGKARVLHMPGELFVEYQLAAQKLRPDLFVAMAAYGDYAPGYIGTEIGYSQGGYETSQRASRTAPEVETVLMQAVHTLLDARTPLEPLGRDGGEWTSLIDGETLEGWTRRGGTATYEAKDGMIVGTTTEGSKNTFLCRGPYSDFVLEFEVLCDKPLNSGVQIRSHVYEKDTPQPSNPKRIREKGEVYGYQCEICEQSKGTAGNFWDEARRTRWLDDFSDKPEARKAYKDGEWNHYRIVAQGDRIRSWVNGVPAADFRDSTDKSGFIGLQVHSIKKGTGPYQVRWRNIRIRELKSVE